MKRRETERAFRKWTGRRDADARRLRRRIHGSHLGCQWAWLPDAAVAEVVRELRERFTCRASVVRHLPQFARERAPRGMKTRSVTKSELLARYDALRAHAVALRGAP